MTGSNSHITILTLNVNGLSDPNERYRLANWIKSQDPLVCYIPETHLMSKNTQRLKIGMEEYLPTKWKAKQSRGSNPSL